MDVKPMNVMEDILSYKTYKATIHFWSFRTPVAAASQLPCVSHFTPFSHNSQTLCH